MTTAFRHRSYSVTLLSHRLPIQKRILMVRDPGDVLGLA